MGWAESGDGGGGAGVECGSARCGLGGVDDVHGAGESVGGTVVK